MRKIYFVMAFVLILSTVVTYSPSDSYACSCIVPPPPKEAMKDATAVFSGKVKSIDAEGGLFQSSADPVRVLFDVKRTWKGVKQSQVIVFTARHSASCGFEFKLNQEYLVYAYERDGRLETTICSRTAHLASAQDDLNALGKGKFPAKQINMKESVNDNATNYILWLLVIIGFIISIFVVRYFLRRKHN